MPSWFRAVFVDRDRRLRNGWWVATFLLLLALLLVPAILVSARAGREVSIAEQALILLAATVVIQALRRKPITEVTGRLNGLWLAQFAIGGALGGLLMAIPAVFLAATGLVRFTVSGATPQALGEVVLLMAAVAVAEELLFRGVLFQRLAAGLGVWAAQILVALLFVLTHLNNPGMEGATKLWAGCNIFIASILFGLAFLRTQSLALPIGLHFMANVMQGAVLGFGVSGEAEPGLLTPHFQTDSLWLTGGAFGLEASLPGLLVLVALVIGLARFRPRPVAA